MLEKNANILMDYFSNLLKNIVPFLFVMKILIISKDLAMEIMLKNGII